MTTAQSAYDYTGYEYGYDANMTPNYQSYPGYETSTAYAQHGAYDGYAAQTAYAPGATAASAYPGVDPYTGYATASYAYPAPSTAPGAPPATAGQTAYTPSYAAPPASAGHPYEPRRSSQPPTTPTAAHYAPYDYTLGAYSDASASATGYSPYKPTAATNGASSANAYQPSAPVPPQHGAYAVPPGSHLSGAMGPPPPAPTHVYGPPPSAAAAGMVPRRPEYYHPPPMSHPMQHYVPHQSQSMPYRLPPRGGYQRELDEPGDENALLRHVVYITGLPKEIQNETLAEVFGAACGQIAPVDVRSPKPKIWVYKDRQTREGKGEATITFVNPESCQTAITYFNGKELFGREVRVTLCPRRMYNMQKQNTPFNPAAPPSNTNTAIKSINTNNNSNVITTTTSTADNITAIATTPVVSLAAATTTSTATITTTTTTTTPAAATPTTTSSSMSVTAACPIATISSSTLGLPRQLNHSLFKLRQTPEQQRGLLPTPPIHYGAPMIGNAMARDGVRKELPRIALNRGNYINPTGVRPKPY